MKIDFNKKYKVRKLGDAGWSKEQLKNKDIIKFIRYEEGTKGVIVRVEDSGDYFLVLNPETCGNKCGFIFELLEDK